MLCTFILPLRLACLGFIALVSGEIRILTVKKGELTSLSSRLRGHIKLPDVFVQLHNCGIAIKLNSLLIAVIRGWIEIAVSRHGIIKTFGIVPVMTPC